jgi:hypothetical protein
MTLFLEIGYLKSGVKQCKNSEFRYQVTAHKEDTPARRKNECSNGVNQAGCCLATSLNESLNNSAASERQGQPLLDAAQ